MSDRIPPGSTTETLSDGRRIIRYPGITDVLVLHLTPRTDPRDARLADLERAMRHIRTLTHDAPTLATVTNPAMILETIYLLACDALAGASEPTATVEEVMAI